MDRDDRSYFARRAAQERQHAERARQPEIRIIHADLADRYDALLKDCPPNPLPLARD
jgi:cellulose biosynthesis protein BcsQ